MASAFYPKAVTTTEGSEINGIIVSPVMTIMKVLSRAALAVTTFIYLIPMRVDPVA